ncbi:MAG: DUF1189 domain-containing protein [Sedimentisphaerales bacterium]|nr:DUF1189 domain-containing protein [Sedimentisphaerales bacterium]
MKKIYSILQAPVLAFYSADFYRDVCFRWRGVGFGYLLLLLIVCWIPLMVKIQLGFSDFVDNEAPKMVSQIPPITIKDGEVSTDVEQPYIIMDPKEQKPIIIIDTTGTVTSLADTEAIVLLTKTQLINRQDDFQTRTYDLKDIDSFQLDQDRINGWLKTAKKYLILFFFILAVFGSWIARMVQALIYGALGFIFCSMCQCQRSYDALLRLAVMAVTPAIIIKTIVSLTGFHIPMAWLWFFLLAMLYLYFGVKATSQHEDRPPQQYPDSFYMPPPNPEP